MLEKSSYKTWVEARDKWYVETLSYAGVPAEDILTNNWAGHMISLKVDLDKGTEQLCIKGEPIGEPSVLHPEALARIRYEHSDKKIIKPGDNKAN